MTNTPNKDVLKVALDALRQWTTLIQYQYTGSKEAMTALQVADDLGQKAIDALSSAKDAAQPVNDDALCHFQYVEQTLQSIAERRRLIGDTIHPINDIHTASGLAKCALDRFRHALASMDKQGAQPVAGVVDERKEFEKWHLQEFRAPAVDFEECNHFQDPVWMAWQARASVNQQNAAQEGKTEYEQLYAFLRSGNYKHNFLVDLGMYQGEMFDLKVKDEMGKAGIKLNAAQEGSEDKELLDWLQKTQNGVYPVVHVIRRPSTISSTASCDEIQKFLGWSVSLRRDESETVRDAIRAAKSAHSANQPEGDGK